MKDKAYTYIFYEILDQVLQLSDKPSQFAEFLSHKIREIIGSRIIVVAVKQDDGSARILSIYPTRHINKLSQELLSLAEFSFQIEKTQILDKEQVEPSVKKMLDKLETEKSIIIPLQVVNKKVGTIMLLDIMDTFGIEAIIDLMQQLSGVFALVIRNSNLYYQLEETVAIRTEELQKRNKELVERETELQRINEEYETLNEELINTNEQLYIAKNEAETNEQKYRSLIEQASDGIFITDERGKYIDVNQSGCEMLGYSKDEIIKMHLFDVMVPEDLAQTPVRLERLNTIQNVISERRLVKKDGTIFIAEISGKKIDDGRFQGIVRDITERKKIENELIQAKQKAEESDRLKSAFLANMSHEIRTPMNAIIGFSDLLSKPELSIEKRKRFTELIQQRSLDLLQIIEDILDISKIEVGQLKFSESIFPLKILFDDIYEYYTQRIKNLNKKINLNISIEPGLKNIILSTDMHRLKQVFSNLIDNAIKFTDKGSITFGCKKYADNNLVFFVSDTGIGIPKEKQEIIFDRFRQADDALTARRYGGSGLGLSIVKGIINQLNGKVWLESEPKKGTAFYFCLPLKNQEILKANSDSENTRSENFNWKKKSLLIVEDDKFNMDFLKEILENSELEIYCAYNGAEALQFIEKEIKPDIILMDIRLPDTNGLILTKTIKEKYPFIKIIAQTAYASSTDQEECRLAGCDDYISKPINNMKLQNLINRFLME